jgi:hypothetical protein
MTCDHDWTIKFRDVNDGDPFEVRPIEMSLKMSRTEYDFCRATLDWEVGEQMKPHTRYEGGAMYGLLPADVCYNGDPIQRLMFRPDWVDYGSENTHLQLHDLHKALGDGVVDQQRDTVNLEEIYTTVVEAASNRLIDEVRFTLPDSQVRTLYGNRSASGRGGRYRQQMAEDDETKKVVESTYAVDFDNISPQKALQRLNQKFRLKSWVNRNGVLVVGLPEANQVRHVAAASDDRVWRYKDPSISHGREPIQSVIVEGAWVDEPGIDLDVLGWFDKGGSNDVKAMGIAKRKDIDYGTSFSVKSTKAKRDALPHVARLALGERMKQQNAGTVELDPALSGTEVSNVIDLTPGDLLQMVPQDDYFDDPTSTSGEVGDSPDNPDEVCGSFVNNEAYLVSEVEHSVSNNGEWQVFADLGMYPDVEIEAYMTYFDPKAGEWVDDDEIADDGSLKGGLFEGI